MFICTLSYCIRNGQEQWQNSVKVRSFTKGLHPCILETKPFILVQACFVSGLQLVYAAIFWRLDNLVYSPFLHFKSSFQTCSTLYGNMASDTDCLWWCRRSTGRSWRKGDAWFPPRRFYPTAPPLKRRQRMNVEAKSTFSLYFLQQKPNKACCSTKVISGGYIKTRAKYLDFDFHPQQTCGYVLCAVQQPQHVVLCNEEFTFSTCRWGRHRWCFWHLWRSPRRRGSWGSFYGPWSYCRFPPESRHRTVCHLVAIT